MSNFKKKVFLYIIIFETIQTPALMKKPDTDTGIDLFENGGAAMFKVVSFDTPTGVVLAVTFASKVKSNYKIDWKAVQHEHKEKAHVEDIEQCKDKLWCNMPGTPYNYIEVILQKLDGTRKFIKTVNIEPLEYRGFDAAAINDQHGCNNHLCMNNGKCVVEPESTLGYVCICFSGYSGENCQHFIHTNSPPSSFLTSGCIVVLFLLIVIGFLIYLHFFRGRKRDTTEKPTRNRKPRSKALPKGPKPKSSQPSDSSYDDTEFPTENEGSSSTRGIRKDDQQDTAAMKETIDKNVRFQVEPIRYDIEDLDLIHDRDPSGRGIGLSEKNPFTDETKPSKATRCDCPSEEPSKDKIPSVSETCSLENSQADVHCVCQCKNFDDSLPSTDSHNMLNKDLPPYSQSDATKPSSLKGDDFENATECNLATKGWETPRPMANEDLLDKNHYYLVSIDKLKSTAHGEKIHIGDLQTRSDFINECCSETSSQDIPQCEMFKCAYDTSSQSSDSSCSCAEESTYCALNNISLQDNCDTFVFIPKRPIDSDPVHAVEDDYRENSNGKEQKLVFPRHSKSGAVIYRLSEPENEPKD
ncbi:uncharacterized protein LOC122554345 [Chiloscyllium plagiosum]|uniref:uncharacterized protein LOC122554345 n=1 Tax=Chiloscyllium plagiosum TaxID=36176 RepID=UPI001CB7B92C|nr:uncharacterized protein LOC122554345 [Chiloscyllium plagiosum]